MENSKAYFEMIAPAWEDMRASFFPDALRDAALAAAGLRPGETAADIGAGSGFMTAGLLARGLKVIAVDQSEAMLAEISKRFGGMVTCVAGDAGRLPLADASVDHAFANMCLHHVTDPTGAISEMARIIKPGGRLVVTDLDTHGFEFLREEQQDLWLGFKREDVRRWFTGAGLAAVKVDCAGQDCCADSAGGRGRARVSIFLAYGEKR